jgi:hypothetical protein
MGLLTLLVRVLLTTLWWEAALRVALTTVAEVEPESLRKAATFSMQVLLL